MADRTAEDLLQDRRIAALEECQSGIPREIDDLKTRVRQLEIYGPERVIKELQETVKKLEASILKPSSKWFG